MQKLTEAEVTQEAFRETRKSLDPRAEAIYKEIGKLGVGEGLKVDVNEWPYKGIITGKQIPARFVLSYAKFNVRRLKDESGFVVIRIA